MAIDLRDFLANGVQTPRDSTTRGMNEPPDASTEVWCFSSFEASPAAAAAPAL